MSPLAAYSLTLPPPALSYASLARVPRVPRHCFLEAQTHYSSFEATMPWNLSGSCGGGPWGHVDEVVIVRVTQEPQLAQRGRVGDMPTRWTRCSDF